MSASGGSLLPLRSPPLPLHSSSAQQAANGYPSTGAARQSLSETSHHSNRSLVHRAAEDGIEHQRERGLTSSHSSMVYQGSHHSDPVVAEKANRSQHHSSSSNSLRSTMLKTPALVPNDGSGAAVGILDSPSPSLPANFEAFPLRFSPMSKTVDGMSSILPGTSLSNRDGASLLRGLRSSSFPTPSQPRFPADHGLRAYEGEEEELLDYPLHTGKKALFRSGSSYKAAAAKCSSRQLTLESASPSLLGMNRDVNTKNGAVASAPAVPLPAELNAAPARDSVRDSPGTKRVTGDGSYGAAHFPDKRSSVRRSTETRSPLRRSTAQTSVPLLSIDVAKLSRSPPSGVRPRPTFTSTFPNRRSELKTDFSTRRRSVPEGLQHTPAAYPLRTSSTRAVWSHSHLAEEPPRSVGLLPDRATLPLTAYSVRVRQRDLSLPPAAVDHAKDRTYAQVASKARALLDEFSVAMGRSTPIQGLQGVGPACDSTARDTPRSSNAPPPLPPSPAYRPLPPVETTNLAVTRASFYQNHRTNISRREQDLAATRSFYIQLLKNSPGPSSRTASPATMDGAEASLQTSLLRNRSTTAFFLDPDSLKGPPPPPSTVVTPTNTATTPTNTVNTPPSVHFTQGHGNPSHVARGSGCMSSHNESGGQQKSPSDMESQRMLELLSTVKALRRQTADMTTQLASAFESWRGEMLVMPYSSRDKHRSWKSPSRTQQYILPTSSELFGDLLPDETRPLAAVAKAQERQAREIGTVVSTPQQLAADTAWLTERENSPERSFIRGSPAEAVTTAPSVSMQMELFAFRSAIKRQDELNALYWKELEAMKSGPAPPAVAEPASEPLPPTETAKLESSFALPPAYASKMEELTEAVSQAQQLLASINEVSERRCRSRRAATVDVRLRRPSTRHRVSRAGSTVTSRSTFHSETSSSSTLSSAQNRRVKGPRQSERRRCADRQRCQRERDMISGSSLRSSAPISSFQLLRSGAGALLVPKLEGEQLSKFSDLCVVEEPVRAAQDLPARAAVKPASTAEAATSPICFDVLVAEPTPTSSQPRKSVGTNTPRGQESSHSVSTRDDDGFAMTTSDSKRLPTPDVSSSEEKRSGRMSGLPVRWVSPDGASPSPTVRVNHYPSPAPEKDDSVEDEALEAMADMFVDWLVALKSESRRRVEKRRRDQSRRHLHRQKHSMPHSRRPHTCGEHRRHRRHRCHRCYHSASSLSSPSAAPTARHRHRKKIRDHRKEEKHLLSKSMQTSVTLPQEVMEPAPRSPVASPLHAVPLSAPQSSPAAGMKPTSKSKSSSTAPTAYESNFSSQTRSSQSTDKSVSSLKPSIARESCERTPSMPPQPASVEPAPLSTVQGSPSAPVTTSKPSGAPASSNTSRDDSLCVPEQVDRTQLPCTSSSSKEPSKETSSEKPSEKSATPDDGAVPKPLIPVTQVSLLKHAGERESTLASSDRDTVPKPSGGSGLLLPFHSSLTSSSSVTVPQSPQPVGIVPSSLTLSFPLLATPLPSAIHSSRGPTLPLVPPPVVVAPLREPTAADSSLPSLHADRLVPALPSLPVIKQLKEGLDTSLTSLSNTPANTSLHSSTSDGSAQAKRRRHERKQKIGVQIGEKDARGEASAATPAMQKTASSKVLEKRPNKEEPLKKETSLSAASSPTLQQQRNISLKKAQSISISVSPRLSERKRPPSGPSSPASSQRKTPPLPHRRNPPPAAEKAARKNPPAPLHGEEICKPKSEVNTGRGSAPPPGSNGSTPPRTPPRPGGSFTGSRLTSPTRENSQLFPDPAPAANGKAEAAQRRLQKEKEKLAANGKPNAWTRFKRKFSCSSDNSPTPPPPPQSTHPSVASRGGTSRLDLSVSSRTGSRLGPATPERCSQSAPSVGSRTPERSLVKTPMRMGPRKF